MDPLTAVLFIAAVLLALLAVYLFVMLWPLLVMAAPVIVLFWLFLHLCH